MSAVGGRPDASQTRLTSAIDPKQTKFGNRCLVRNALQCDDGAEYLFTLCGIPVMPLNEIPAFFHPEIRSLIDSTLEQAWLELQKDNPNDEVMARRKLATTIVALAAIGETDPAKLKHFALHATRAAGLGMKPAVQKTARKSAVAHSI
jgi:hypothetical protein